MMMKFSIAKTIIVVATTALISTPAFADVNYIADFSQARAQIQSGSNPRGLCTAYSLSWLDLIRQSLVDDKQARKNSSTVFTQAAMDERMAKLGERSNFNETGVFDIPTLFSLVTSARSQEIQRITRAVYDSKPAERTKVRRLTINTFLSHLKHSDNSTKRVSPKYQKKGSKEFVGHRDFRIIGNALAKAINKSGKDSRYYVINWKIAPQAGGSTINHVVAAFSGYNSGGKRVTAFFDPNGGSWAIMGAQGPWFADNLRESFTRTVGAGNDNQFTIDRLSWTEFK